MRILLTGSNGKIGGFLAHHWRECHQVLPLTRAEVDLTDEDALTKYLDGKEFDVLVNCAALSTPEGCESDPALADAVNTRAPEVMAQRCASKGARLIHLSTDYVLAGETPGWKDETATTASSQSYGGSKLAGERAVRRADPLAVIARVSWVFGSSGEGFLEKIYRLALAGAPLEAVADKFSMPTASPDLAEGLEVLFSPEARGVFHLTHWGEDPVSWHSYAQEVILAMHQLEVIAELIPVTPRKMSEIPALASNRPQHTAMTPSRLQLEFGHEMRNWKDAVHERVAQLAEKQRLS